MANIQKTLTYSLPDVMYSSTTDLGKTSTMNYDGPSEIVLWIDKETGYLEQCHCHEEEPDCPLPLHLRREILKADTDVNTIKIALLWGGIEEPKVYEVSVGPSDQPNAIIPDPTHICEVYNEYALYDDYKKPLEFRKMERSAYVEGWNFLRQERNHRLSNSDGKLAEDMPDSLKQQWREYRQKLRDMPVTWDGVPGNLVRFPPAPDDGPDPNFNDEHVKVTMISERSSDDDDAVSMLPNGVN
tara:strand:- start:4448 stop:5173 length:726 start_codon:yes stop_codon:yes gene_type:complete